MKLWHDENGEEEDEERGGKPSHRRSFHTRSQGPVAAPGSGTMDAVITQPPHTTVMNVVHIFVNLRDRRDVLAGVEPVRISIVLRDNLP